MTAASRQQVLRARYGDLTKRGYGSNNMSLKRKLNKDFKYSRNVSRQVIRQPTSDSKCFMLKEINADWNAHSMLTHTVQFPERGYPLPTDDMRRTADSIHLNGFKIQLRVTNGSTFPIRVNYAVLQRRAYSPGGGQITATEVRDNFFKNQKGQGSKWETFIDSNTNGSLAYDNYEINNDKWTVLQKKVIPLYGTLASDQMKTDRIDTYFKVNKRFNFSAHDDKVGNFPYVIAMWWNPADIDQDPVSGGMRVEAWTKVYFKDVI